MEKRTKANSHRQITVIAFDALKDDPQRMDSGFRNHRNKLLYFMVISSNASSVLILLISVLCDQQQTYNNMISYYVLRTLYSIPHNTKRYHFYWGKKKTAKLSG